MKKQRKEAWLRLRVDAEMRQALDRLADQRGEASSVIIREAVREYLEAKERWANRIPTS